MPKVRLDQPRPGRVTLIGPATFVATIAGRVSERGASGGMPSSELQRGARRHAHRADHPGADRPRRRDPARRTARTTPSASLDELALLVDTAGADEVGRVDAAPRRARPRLLHRQGQGRGAARAVPGASTPTPWCSTTSSRPAQQYNLEKLLGRTAIDRTAVILDIFAQNAHTLEGKAQVELALLRYRLPRLRRGTQARLSQQARRHRHPAVRARPSSRSTGAASCAASPSSRHDLRDLAAHPPAAAAEPRPAAAWPPSRIVGYTNAGKSTLLNRLTDAGVLVEDRLFATLDPTTRRLALPGGEPVLLTDTVGFVRKPAPRAGRGVQEHARGRGRGRPARARRRRQRRPIPRRRSTPSARCWPRSAPTRCPSCSSSTRPTWRPRRPCRLVKLHPGSVAISARDRATASTTCCGRSATGCARSPPSSSCSSPTTGATSSPPSTARARSSRPADDDDGIRVRARLDDGRPPGGWPSSSSRRRDRDWRPPTRHRAGSWPDG